jgi:hypothetical protein
MAPIVQVATSLGRHHRRNCAQCFIVELRNSSSAFDVAISSMRQTLDALQSANNAQGRAIDRVRSANKVALALFHDEGSPY